MKYLLSTLLLGSSLLWAQTSLLQSGPMVGYAHMKEVMLWAQSNEAATLQFAYWEVDKPEHRFYTDSVHTQKNEGYTAHLLADQVEPGKTYGYHLLINHKVIELPYPTRFQTPPLWQYRTDPPLMRIGMGSCAFVNDSLYDRPGKPYGGGYEVFTSLAEKKPDIMLWLGDNTYLREADWDSKTGMLYRYTHTRSLPELQPLLASSSHYALWDDHDFGPNNSDRTFVQKNQSLEIFKYFWANPTYGIGDIGGTVSSFEWGDAQFFLLDNRFFRTPNNWDMGEREILGKAQLRWLEEALVSSQANFKFVCIGGQFLNTVQKFETHAHIAPDERRELLNTLVNERVKNVIFLSGDRHHNELSHYAFKGVNFYDWTVSPLTSGAANAQDEANFLRVDGSYFGERSFGILELSGPRKERLCKLSLYNTQGEMLWNYTIEAH